MKLNLSKKQKKIFILTLIFLLILGAGFILFVNNKHNIKQLSELKSDFLDESEKINLNIKPETKIQVLKRDAAGNVVLYKVIRKDSDIITDLGQIKADTPRQQK